MVSKVIPLSKSLMFTGDKDTFSTLPPLPLETLILYDRDREVNMERLREMTTLKALTAGLVYSKDIIQNLLTLTFLQRLTIPTLEQVDLKPLLTHTNLQGLTVHEYTSCPEQLEVLGQCSLTSLNLSKSNIGDVELAILALNTNLTSLNIEDTHVTTSGLTALASHPNLDSLYLPLYNMNIKEAIASLEPNTTISTLKVKGCTDLELTLPVLKYRVRNLKIRKGKQRSTAMLLTVLAHCFL